MKFINNNVELSIKIQELIDFLKFSFKFKTKKKVLFTLINDEKKHLYDILIDINTNENNMIIIDEKIICENYDTYIILTEKLLLELYCQGASIITIFKKYMKGEFKTKKFSYKKFNSFLSNFNFSEEYWNDFYSNKID
tara:strand:- start:1272 stop:1685 length:414 start_codon:yes stop_codon:yes gene_type:complete